PKPFQTLIAPFAHYMRTGLPWVTLKWAESQDGFISETGEETPITGEESRIQVHALRAAHQVVLVGSRTVLIDDPRLTTRMYPGPDPQRWVWDTQFKIPDSHPFFTSAGKAFRLCYTPKSALDIGIPEISNVHSFLQWAAQKQQISSLLVEGGAETLSFFLKENDWQEIFKYVNHSLFLKSGTLAPEIRNVSPVHSILLKTETVTQYQYLQA
ncbi:MAG: RibD family protein, partial [Sphingobacteriia bacterium]|nr:RibD family protein [Sphingobacteriia bacterium]